MNYLATLLVALMAAVYLCTFTFDPAPGSAIGYLRAFAEAALIGSLADWFAVVALFRHPLGLPIPHTAILPNNKARIGEALSAFIRENFFTETTVKSKVLALSPTTIITKHLLVKEKRDLVAEKVLLLCGDLIRSLSDTTLQNFALHLGETITQRGINVAKMSGVTLDALLKADKDEVISKGVVGVIGGLVTKHEDFLRESFGRERPWYMPKFLEHQLYRSFIAQLNKVLRAVSCEEGHPLRTKLREDLGELSRYLQNDAAAAAAGREICGVLLRSNELHLALKHCLAVIIPTSAQEDADNSAARDATSHLLLLIAETLEAAPEVRARLDILISAASGRFIGAYSSDLLKLISETVNSWDAKTFVGKLEQYIWHDLQFIRINGTLVGGLIGVVLYTFAVWMGNR